MTPKRWLLGALPLALFAPAGVLAGHGVLHARAAADPAARAALLDEVAHTGLALAVPAAAALALCGLVWAFVGRPGEDVRTPHGIAAFLPLAAVQSLACIGLQVTELVLASGSHGISHHDVLLAGVAAQTGTAALLAAAAWIAQRCGGRLRALVPAFIVPRAEVVRPPRPRPRTTRRVAAVPLGLRAPPLPTARR